MIQELDIELLPREASQIDYITAFCATKLNVAVQRVSGAIIVRRSVDARKSPVKVNLRVRVFIDEPVSSIAVAPQHYKQVAHAKPVLIVGAGPAGLFAALRLLELGLKPIVFERGKNVSDRKKDLAKLYRLHELDPESNYGFGEGGAGTFSDGKLYTRSKKRGNTYKVLETFVLHGAHESILVDTHPHIGTDKLPAIISNMRKCIEEHGGEVHFQSKVSDFLFMDNEVKGVVLHDGTTYPGPVILATGHSARDMYELLHNRNIPLESKAFAMGVRMEHPQSLIDRIQYHNPKGRGDYLPAAPYRFVTQVNGRGVYSFCMCPGGIVVPAATGINQVVVNGMSASSRGSKWANSGIVVELHPEDLPSEYTQFGVMAGLMFQKDLEEECYRQGGGQGQKAPAQALKDFCENIPSTDLPSSSYVPGLTISPLHEWVPEVICKRLQEGIKQFAKQAKGLMTNDAVVVGVESRTSSPLRIPRHADHLEHISISNLYPCGEGAGYAGGIVSSAIDGIRCAEECALKNM